MPSSVPATVTNDTSDMLELQDLTRRFGTQRAVDGVSLAIPAGQMVGVIGRSGAGKSTLLRLIDRLVEPSDGRILADGTDVAALGGRALRRWRRDCAMIFQQFNLVPRLDVLTNVMLGRLERRSRLDNLIGRFSRAERLDALAALERLGIADTAAQLASTLSGGQQQRVAIARALVQSPRIILADEPIASLDPLNARLVMQSLADINREDGRTVIVNLHTLDTARRHCERIVGMARGRVVFDGPPDALDDAAVRHVYGVDDEDAALAGGFSERETSSVLGVGAASIPAPVLTPTTSTLSPTSSSPPLPRPARPPVNGVPAPAERPVANRRTPPERVPAPTAS